MRLGDDEHQSSHRQDRDRELGPRQEPDGVPHPAADDVEDRRSDGDPDQEQRQDHGEDVGESTGPGRKQPGPRHLVAQ